MRLAWPEARDQFPKHTWNLKYFPKGYWLFEVLNASVALCKQFGRVANAYLMACKEGCLQFEAHVKWSVLQVKQRGRSGATSLRCIAIIVQQRSRLWLLQQRSISRLMLVSQLYSILCITNSDHKKPHPDSTSLY